MARNTSTPDAPSVAFEVERSAWTASDRLELTGRWFGLRGHRFMRPALLVEAGDGRRRLLALLEHKPWAADDGEAAPAVAAASAFDRSAGTRAPSARAGRARGGPSPVAVRLPVLAILIVVVWTTLRGVL